ncbi:hypothetical protein [Fictibacillus sp. KU28468]|nr:hypothetical protein [Fictibacillus sp. KU28468]UZJ80569.1 hypothetical protein OKX00_09020 [Fictibacillus sp. KU28468]
MKRKNKNFHAAGIILTHHPLDDTGPELKKGAFTPRSSLELLRIFASRYQ